MSVERDGQNDLSGWLSANGLEKYLDVFTEHEIDLDVLEELDQADLKEMGVSLGDRKRFMKAISAGKDIPTEADQRQAERRQLTVLFCDLVGSTGLASKFDPEDTSAMIQGYQGVCSDVVKRWGGHIAQYLGDGIMVYFGWPVGSENDAERAVRAALEMVEVSSQRLAPDGKPLAVRIGVATGLVMVGEVIGEAHSKLEAAIGATPNVAAKLQSLASPNGVVVSDSTLAQLPDKFVFDDLGTQEFSGLERDVRAWNLVRLTESPDGQPEKDTAPLVGRSDELQTLMDHWTSTQAGQGARVQVIAGTGVGKSRLVSAFFESIGLDPAQLIRLNGSAFHTVTSFFPVIEELRRQIGLYAVDDTGTAVKRLNDFVANAEIETSAATVLLGQLLGLPVEMTPEFQGLSAQLRRAQTMDILVGLFTTPPNGKPHVLLVEDVHWLDPSTLELVETILARDCQTMVLLTMRPEEQVRDWARNNVAKSIRLDGLSNDLVHELVLAAAGGKSLPQEATAKIVEYTDGVPLFINELTKAVLDSGQLELGPEGYALRDDELQLHVPDTLQGSLISRLDKRPSAKPVAQAAATIGRYFSAEVLARVMDMELDEIEEHLKDLVHFEVLAETRAVSGRGFGFVHAMVQETAYMSQLRQNRRNVHARIVDVLQVDFPESDDNRPEVLARHYSKAGMRIEAAAQYLAAGRVAISQSAVEEAVLQLRKGLEQVQPLAPDPERDQIEMRIQASIGTALMLAKGWAAPEVQDTYLYAASLSDAATNVNERLWIMWGAWVSRHVHGRISKAQEMTAQMNEIACESGERSAMLIGKMVALQSSFYSGRFKEARDVCQAMRDAFDPAEDRSLVNLYSTDLEIVALVHQSIAHWAMGQHEESRALLREIDGTVRRVGHEYTIAWALTWGATVPILMDDLQMAKKMVSEGRAIAEARGYDYVQSLASIQMAYIDYHNSGDVALADDMLAGVKAFQSTGADIAVPHFKTMIAWTLLDAGRADEAMSYLREAEEQIQSFGEAWQLGNVMRTKAEALAQTGADRAEVEAAYELAFKVTDDQGGHTMTLRAALSQAEFLRKLGADDQADDVLLRAIGCCKPQTSCPEFNLAKNSARAFEK